MNSLKNLSYKCRPGSNFNTKSRVYFSYHPNDFEHFNYISNMILAKQDCVIYFYDYSREEPDPDEMSEFLMTIKLLVIPVSIDYLTHESFALSFEYKFAIKNHIPILPLLQSESLSTLFNDVCGERHYLIENTVDDTGIPFEEKLSRFLRSVLLTDETVKQIQSSFAGQVFLSYRRKDRKKINECMQLIHEDIRCRDISFWYDENLVPGENFSLEIQTKIKESGLFVLLATENIYESGNYVLDKEYPFAVLNEKPVIAIEHEGTSHKALLSAFTGLNDVFSISAKKEIHDAVVEKMQLGDRQNNNPDHLFLIGLAYHSGIGVERNPRFGIELIEQAAIKMLPEAISKLAHIYHVGDGTTRDIHRAITWQKEYVNLLKNQYSKIATRDKTNELYYQRELLSIYCREAAMYGDAISYSEENASLEPKIAKQEMNPVFSLLSQAQGLQNRGLIYDLLGQRNKAEECVLQAIRILESLDEGKGHSINAILSSSYGIVGACFMNHNKFEAAAHYYQKALDLYLSLSNVDNNSLINTYLCLGRIFGDQNSALYDYSKAEEYYLEALRISESSMKNNPKWGGYSFEPYHRIVDFYSFHNHLDQSERFILSAIQSSKQLLDSNPQRSCEEMVNVLYGTACFYAKHDYSEIAEECFLAAEKQCEDVVMMNPGWTSKIAHLRTIRNGISQFYYSISKDHLAIHYFQKANERQPDSLIYEKERNSCILQDFNLAEICIAIAESYSNNQSILSAEKYYIKGINLYRMMISLKLCSPEPKLAKAENKIARFYEVNDQGKLAEMHYKSALSIWKALADSNRQEYHAVLVANYTNLGLFYKNIGRINDSKNMLLHGISEAEKCPNACDAELADACESIGQLFEECKSKALAKYYYTKALTIYDELARNDGRYETDALDIREKLRFL